MRDKPRVEELMSELFAFSQKLLREHGGFHPFGGLVRLNGSMVYVGCRPVGDDAGAERFDGLVAALGHSSGGLLAVGVAANVEIDSGSAIRIFIEHRQGYCADVFFPYALDGDQLTVGDHYAMQATPRIFG
jgi:hypothetical protein